MKNAEPLSAAAITSTLIVDDDSFIQDYFSEMLSALHISDIHIASNGSVGLRTLAQMSRPPDFLICDVFMPDKDGIEFLDDLAYRKYQGGIILVSGLDVSVMDIAQQIALNKGLNVWGAFCKPVSFATLTAALNAHGLLN
jgi:response regulator of citrate/malate metabolism